MEEHHRYSAEKHPQLADAPDTVYPGTLPEHKDRWHGGDYRNPTDGATRRADKNEESWMLEMRLIVKTAPRIATTAALISEATSSSFSLRKLDDKIVTGAVVYTLDFEKHSEPDDIGAAIAKTRRLVTDMQGLGVTLTIIYANELNGTEEVSVEVMNNVLARLLADAQEHD